MMLAGVVLFWGADYYFLRICPPVPDESSGHIYQINLHGIVYLTYAERRLWDRQWVITAIAVFFLLIPEVIVPLIRLSIRGMMVSSKDEENRER
jgi:hypothetical protein